VKIKCSWFHNEYKSARPKNYLNTVCVTERTILPEKNDVKFLIVKFLIVNSNLDPKIEIWFACFLGYASVRPFLYFELFTLTFCQIWTSYWSRQTSRSTVLVEVKFAQRGRSKVLPKRQSKV